MCDNPLFSSFMMLSEHLYQEFVQYIVHKRTRAPPETSLIEMLPTFQFGAKTDRRALQSKFKSWAKRMTFENGYLKLTNSGKIIIPREKCDNLVMYLHSEEHHDIEKIISQIRVKYSWTKKNFGMDRDVVVESIMRHCKKESCHHGMRMEMARMGTSLCTSQLNSQMPHMFPELAFGMPPPMPCLPPFAYRWPIAFPVPPVFPPSEFSFRIPFFGDMYNIRNPIELPNKANLGNPMTDRVSESNLGMRCNTVRGKGEETILAPSSSNSEEKMLSLKFRKPKNVYEYRALMEAVRNKPTEFPKVLGMEKTQFLSIFGIAPKSACSSRTLKKFHKELAYKRLMNRECMIYRQRKVLRDRNKLKKCSHEKSNRVFLGMTARKNSTSTTLEKTGNEMVTSKKPRLPLDVSRKLNSGQNNEGCAAKKLKIFHLERKEAVEEINIASSDDEIQLKHSSSFKKINEKEESGTIDKENQSLCGFETQGQGNVVPRSLIPETTNDLSHVGTDINISKKYADKNEKIGKNAYSDNNANNSQNKNDDRKHNIAKNVNSDENVNDRKNENDRSFKHENLSKKCNAETQSKSSVVHKQPINEINNRFLHAKPILLPKAANGIPNITQLSNPSNIPLEATRFQAPQMVSSEVKPYSDSLSKYSTNYLLPQANAAPVVLQPITPSTVQQNFVIAKRNNIPRLVYSLPVPRSPPNVKLYMADREQNDKLYVVPSFNASILPYNFPKSRESQATFHSNAANAPVSMPSGTSQIHQLRQMKTGDDFGTERSRLENEWSKEKSKIIMKEEMARISRWIYRMKANLNPNMFQHGIEKPVHKLLSQLDVGIYLVREAKKCLAEIENSMNGPIQPRKVAE